MLNASRPGAVFLVLFTGSIIPLGELIGSFADPDRQFISLFLHTSNRVGYLAGSASLVLAGLAFIWFAHALSREAESRRVPLLITGSAAGGGMIVAGLAFATVPLSLAFGSFVDDPGLEVGQAVLPQFGFVALGLGAMLPVGVFMVISARVPGLLPQWLSLSTYPLAILVALTAFLFMPLALFVMWVLAVTASQWRRDPVRG